MKITDFGVTGHGIKPNDRGASGDAGAAGGSGPAGVVRPDKNTHRTNSTFWGSKKGKTKPGGFLKTFLVGFALILLILIPVQFGLANLLEQPVIGGSEVLPDEIKVPELDLSNPNYDLYHGAERMNILLLGLKGGLTDTIMLGSYDIENQRVDIISMPRDTYYERELAKTAEQRKLNAVYGKEGAVGTARAVSDILGGIPIHYYAVVKYEAVEKAVDAVGGVPVNIPINMDYDDRYDKPELHIHFKKGDHVLSGKEAIGYLRFRHNNDGSGYPDQDIGRIRAQQEFMKAAFKKALGVNLPKVITTVMDNVESSDLTIGTALKLATKATGLDAANITGHTLPGEGHMKDRLSYWFLDEEETAALVKSIYTPDATSGAAISQAAISQ
jgi:LCP family protein required for cell wall assembly